MAITSLDGIIAAPKQFLSWFKTATRAVGAGQYFTGLDLAGNPGAGTLAGSSTTAGVVPTDATTGFPVINAFSGANKGYISLVDFASNVASRIVLFDLLFKAGAYSFNASQALSSQPSYSTRIPGGTDYTSTEIWFECVTAFTGNPSIAVTYTNQDGTAGRTTGTVGFGSPPTLGRMIQMPFQAGDTGVQKIESVTATVASVGTFNIIVVRRLWSGRVIALNCSDRHDALKTGMVEVYADSALYYTVSADSTSSGLPEVQLQISNG